MWTPVDDDIGGALISGTFMVTGEYARIEESPVQMIARAQGIEVEKTYDCTLRWPASGVFERDELRVSFPPDHLLYNQVMRVVAVTRDSLPRDNRGHVEILLKKVIRAFRQWP
jgi:hypothetical protein